MTRELVQLRKVRRLTGGEYDAEPGVWCVRDGAGLVPLGEGRGPGPVSPDGRWLISLPAAWWTRGEAGVELIDLTGVEPRRTGTWATGYQGTPTGAAVPFDLEQERSPASQYAHAACWWDQPYRAVPGGLRGLDGSLVPWPQVLTGEPEVLAVGGASVLLRDAVGEWAWDRDGVRRLPACDDEAAAGPWRVDAERWLSPRGRWVLAWAQRTDVPTRLLGSALADVSLARPARLVALDLAQGASARWQTLWESAREQAELVRYWGAFSPGEDYLVLGADEPGAASESDEMTYQLIRLSDAARPLGSHPSQGRPLWTPAGELVLLGEGYVTFADGEPELHDWPSACRAGGRRIAESPPYLRVIRAESGLRLLCDGEDWELLRLDLRDPAAEQVVPRDLGADLPF